MKRENDPGTSGKWSIFRQYLDEFFLFRYRSEFKRELPEEMQGFAQNGQFPRVVFGRFSREQGERTRKEIFQVPQGPDISAVCRKVAANSGKNDMPAVRKIVPVSGEIEKARKNLQEERAFNKFAQIKHRGACKRGNRLRGFVLYFCRERELRLIRPGCRSNEGNVGTSA
ncbi:MAG: hypothetical protein BWY20_02436 [Spirochaetes bacterium ADurb.Bin215]|nr:MAG: hypothetical protein BWY20_02436 [Spirochaetes bacterium ADurb.Bin215]